MSSISQTPRRAPMSLGIRFGLSMLVMAGIVSLAAQVDPHRPDLALFTALSPVIKIHLVTALAALALGGVLMTVRNGRTFHRVAGWVWVSLVMVTAGATLFITELNHGSWSFLHLFTGWVLLITPLAVFWVKRRDIRRHRKTMMGVFYGGFAINLFVAFMPGRTLWMMFFG